MKFVRDLAREVGRAFADIGGRASDPLVEELARAIRSMTGGSGGSESKPKRHLSRSQPGEQPVLKLKDRV